MKVTISQGLGPCFQIELLTTGRSAALETESGVFEALRWLKRRSGEAAAGNGKEQAWRRSGKASKRRNGERKTIEAEGTTILRSVLAMSISHNFTLRVSNPISKYIESCVEPEFLQHCSQQMYARKNSKPQGLEEHVNRALLNTDRKDDDTLRIPFGDHPLTLERCRED